MWKLYLDYEDDMELETPFDAPSMSILVREGLMEARAYTQNQVFEAGVQFARTQGFIPGPELVQSHRFRRQCMKMMMEKMEARSLADLVNISSRLGLTGRAEP